MARTISSSYSSGITLSGGDNPVSITSAGTINDTANGQTGLYGVSGTAWYVTNSGQISETGIGGSGIALAAAGTIVNTDLATIAGNSNGVFLLAGGAVTNQSGGTISGYFGVNSPNARTTVVNAGAIYGNPAPDNGVGVYLGNGGAVTNLSGGTISGFLYGVTVNNRGTIDNQGLIESSESIVGSGARYGVNLSDGGLVTNGSSGDPVSSAYILGYNIGIRFGGAGVGTLINYGTVSGAPDGQAVTMATGTIINGPSGATGALLRGGDQDSDVLIGGSGTVVNYGSIIGSELTGDIGIYYGISIGGAGTISNLGSNSLIEDYVAIYAATNDTVTNAGTIAAMISGVPAAEAIVFGGGTNRLVVVPGAVFIGGISGDGAVTLAPTGSTTVIGTSHGAAVTTMELASGASAGTIAGLGSTITNFASLTFDPGAQWTVVGNASASGLGTLGIGGFTFGDTIDLTGFVAVSRTFTSNALVLTDGGGAHATLAIQGAFTTNDFQISGDGTGGTDINEQADLAYGQTIDATGIVATSETVTAGVLTLLNGGSPVGTINVGTSLSTGDFVLASDGASGTDVIVSTVFGTYGAGVTLVVPVTTISSTGTVSFAGIPGNAAVSGPGGTTWNLTNHGTIAVSAGGSYGVSFSGGGTVTNTASISGGGDGVYIGSGGGNGLVVNQGSIYGTNDYGVYLISGGQITNTAGAIISGRNGGATLRYTDAVVSNLGRIVGGTLIGFGYGLDMRDGGLVTNGQSGAASSTASILGYTGLALKSVEVGNAIGTLINFGTVIGQGTAARGVLLSNDGTITNGPSGATAALIEGGRYGVTAAQAVVVNYATIEATGSTGSYGIDVQNAGTVSNLGTASLIEGTIGVLLQTDGTLTNGGTIASSQGSLGGAVQFDGGNARLIADPGAVFTGYIYGGVGGTAVMELASADAAGTLSGFGTTITNFTSLTFDPGARWTVAGNASASGLGTLGIGGFTFGDTIDLTGFVAVSRTFASNALVLTDGGGAHETLAIQGAFTTNDFQISGDGTGGTDINEQPDLIYGQTIDAVGIVATSETVAAGVLTLLNGGSPVGTINVGTSLSTGDFVLAPDGGGGTDVIVSTVFGTYGAGVTLVVPVTTISSTGTVSIAGGGIAVSGPGGTTWNLTNNGTLVVSGPGYGVSFAQGATVTNTASISGRRGGVYIGVGGGSGLVVNQGSINGTDNYGVYLPSGGQVTNTAGATISGGRAGAELGDTDAVVSNLGRIVGTASGPEFGVYMRDGGLVTNGQRGAASSTASILGYTGLALTSNDVANAIGTLINFGTVIGQGTAAEGVLLSNDGTITNGPSGATAALIDGGHYGVTAAQAVVVNYATIEATGLTGNTYGIEIQNAGTISNLGTASLIEGSIGVLLQTDGTLTNAGTIASNQGNLGGAVRFNGGNARLIADPGAVFTGYIYGGVGGTAVMELASADAAGTLSGFGTTITNFTSLTFDPGARWTVAGNASASGLGTLGIGGFTFGDTIDLTGFVAVSRTFASNKLVLTNGGGAHETLAIQGAFTTGEFQIASDGTGGTDINEQADLAYGQTIDATGIIATSETVTAGVLTLLNGGSPVGTINVGTSLSTGDFVLAPDGTGGTDVIVSTIFGTYGAGVTLVVPVTTISSTGSINFAGSTGSAAVSGPLGTAWNLTNNGTAVNTGAVGYGVWLHAGGTVNNIGLINSGVGILISSGAGVVVNQGSITGNQGIYLASGGQVTNAAGATISAADDGIRVSGTAATVSNLGQVAATANSNSAYGIYLRDGGLVTNGQSGASASTASILGYYGLAFKSVDVVNALGTLINFGTVIGQGPAESGVLLSNGGTVVNGPSGATAALIEGDRYGVANAQGQVVNYGTIDEIGLGGGDYGVDNQNTGSVSNLGTASLIEGYVGVMLETNGTLTNAGTIASNEGVVGVAVKFGGGDARLIADPGAVFTGGIYGGSGGTAVMELASAASAGTLTGFGTTITNFTSVVFDSGAQWTIGGNDSATGLGTLEITGFTTNDTIDLTGFVAVSETFASNVLVLTNGGGTNATLNVDGVFASGDFQISSDGGSGTDIIVCYAKGTRIATPAGERPIEDLEPGDLVQSHFGGPVPVRWVGRRHVDCTRHPDPRAAWPVRVAAGSFGPACPHRDLFLSPNHAVCVLGDLIPIKYLINGTSIAQVPVDEVTYYHVELAEHDMLWAEGLQAESYLDVGDRENFANGGGAVRLFPDFAADNAMLWEAKGCAPLVVHGARLQAARGWVNSLVDGVVSVEVMAA